MAVALRLSLHLAQTAAWSGAPEAGSGIHAETVWLDGHSVDAGTKPSSGFVKSV